MTFLARRPVLGLQGLLFLILGLAALIAAIHAPSRIVFIIPWALFTFGIIQSIVALVESNEAALWSRAFAGAIRWVFALLILIYSGAWVFTYSNLITGFFLINGVFYLLAAQRLRYATNLPVRFRFWTVVLGLLSLTFGIFNWTDWPSAGPSFAAVLLITEAIATGFLTLKFVMHEDEPEVLITTPAFSVAEAAPVALDRPVAPVAISKKPARKKAKSKKIKAKKSMKSKAARKPSKRKKSKKK